MHTSIAFECFEERAIAIGSQLNICVFPHHDLSICIHCGQHLLWEEYEGRFLTSKISILFEELYRLIVIFEACHDEHLALQRSGRYERKAASIIRLNCLWCDIVSIHLSFEESFRKDLEKSLVRRETNVVLSFWTIET